MEEVLTVYHRPYSAAYPLVCFDEAGKQHLKERCQPLPLDAGQPPRYDYTYEREGVSNLFMLFAPLENWRHVTVTDQHTMIDFAQCMKALSDTHFPHAEQITVVLDNLSTHKPAALYQAFAPQLARHLLDRLAFVYTPVHGSWLNMAEIELSMLQRQCLDRRIPDQTSLQKEVAAWQEQRNNAACTIDWRFTTDEARITLKRLYPSVNKN